jgi:glutathione S-transferase
MIQIWYAPGTIALASLIALEEAGADYAPMRLSFADNDQRSDAYLQINPKGRVPALVTAEGILTETPAILTWIAATHPAARLLPSDPFRAARVQEICAYLCSTVHVSHAHWRRGARWSDDPAVIDALRLKVPANMAEHFRYLSGRIEGPWVMGEDYTIADPYLFTLATWLERDEVDVATLPVIAAFRERMQARPAVQRALKVMA